jgi:hypothetical protein
MGLSEPIGALVNASRIMKSSERVAAPNKYKNATVRRTTEPTVSSGATNLYDRSLQQRRDRDNRLAALESKIMEDCTFTPKTSKSWVSHQTATTHDSSGCGGEESVFSRLYRTGTSCSTGRSSASPPPQGAWDSAFPLAPTAQCCALDPVVVPSQQRQSQVNEAIPSRMTVPISTLPNTHGPATATPATFAMSQRMQGAYQKHVQKMRGRSLTEMDEKVRRDRNYEDKEQEQCTFRPTTHWGRRSQGTSGGKPHVKRSSIIMEPKALRNCPQPSWKPHPKTETAIGPDAIPVVPREILVVNFDDSCEYRRESPEMQWEDHAPWPNGRDTLCLQPLPLSPLRPTPSLDGFESIAGRQQHTPQGKQSGRDFQVLLNNVTPEKQTGRSCRIVCGSVGSI